MRTYEAWIPLAATVAVYFPSPPPACELVYSNGEVIRGAIVASSVLIPQGATVRFDADTQLCCTDTIVIDGELLGVSPQPSATLESGDAPDLVLIANRITVRGAVRGGNGAAYGELAPEEGLGREGGDGSSIEIHASDHLLIDTTGSVAAGHGGSGGPGEKGGQGGSVRVTGAAFVPDDWPSGRAAILGGRGGKGGAGFLPGQRGGDGGDSGGVSVVVPETAESHGSGAAEGGSSRLAGSESWAVSMPPDATLDESADFLESIAKSSLPPNGFTLDEWKGRFEAFYTGIVVPSTGEHQVLVTILDDGTDMHGAELRLDDRVVQTLTRDNGKIVDRGPLAIGSATLLVPASKVFDLEVEWWANDGETRLCGVTEL